MRARDLSFWRQKAAEDSQRCKAVLCCQIQQLLALWAHSNYTPLLSFCTRPLEECADKLITHKHGRVTIHKGAKTMLPQAPGWSGVECLVYGALLYGAQCAVQCKCFMHTQKPVLCGTHTAVYTH